MPGLLRCEISPFEDLPFAHADEDAAGTGFVVIATSIQGD
jgi:hypothetical protein